MKIFITATFKYEENKPEIEHLCSLVKKAGFQDFCFVRDMEDYQETFSDSRKLMLSAKDEIESCDALLIDFSEKSTGRTLEAGMAFAMGKKIIAIVKRGTNLKDTARGVCDAVIEYDEIDDIVPKLKKIKQGFKK
jgi:nucleoside 2-deoxyribosyltransferase